MKYNEPLQGTLERKHPEQESWLLGSLCLYSDWPGFRVALPQREHISEYFGLVYRPFASTAHN